MNWVCGEDLYRWRDEAIHQIAQRIADQQERTDYLRDLDWLLTGVANLDRLALRLATFRQLPRIEITRSLTDLSQLWQQRLEQRVPVQYLLGMTPWRDFTLQVAPGVLIPRPETELLIDLAQAWVTHHPTLQATSPMRWADVGTGSGAIALGLARSFPQARIHAVDCSPIAVAIAHHNAAQLNLTEQVYIYQGEWLNPLGDQQGHLDGMISNPPYIPSAVISTLQPEVAQHEPHLALDGGKDGLAAIRIIVERTPSYLRSGGVLLLEIMMGQVDAVTTLLQRQGEYENIHSHADLAGIQRFIQATRH